MEKGFYYNTLIIPTIISDEVFKQTFEKAELAKFWQVELANDEKSLKICIDLKGILNTAFVEGKNEKSIELVKIMSLENEPAEKK